jgi:hypothetical protein
MWSECVVAVDEVSDGLVGDLRDGALEVLAEQRRSVHHDDTVTGGHEHGVVRSRGHVVGAVVDLLDVVALGEPVGQEQGAIAVRRYRAVVGEGVERHARRAELVAVGGGAGLLEVVHDALSFGVRK